MKRIFFFALASLALASCSQDDEIIAEKSALKSVSDRSNTDLLSFSAYTAGQTRATDVASDDVKTSGFMVNAVYNGKMYISNDKAINNLGYNGGLEKQDGVFDTNDNTYYWPIDVETNNVEFFAFNALTDATSAATASFVTPPAVGEAPATAKPANQIAYTVADESDKQQDLVVAHAVAAKKPANGVQPLNFTHALSKINFSFVGADKNKKYDYIVRKIDVLTTKGEGICTINADTTGLGVGKGDTDQPTNDQFKIVTWSFADPKATVPGTGSSIYNSSTSGATAAGGMFYNYTMTDTAMSRGAARNLDNNLMLYPTDGRVAIRVYYKVVDNTTGAIVGDCGYTSKANGNGVDVYGYKTVVLSLGVTDDADNTAVPVWQAGKAYRYTLTLPIANFIGDKNNDGVADDLNDADGDNLSGGNGAAGPEDADYTEFDTATPIRFSVTVSDWETTENNSNIVIK